MSRSLSIAEEPGPTRLKSDYSYYSSKNPFRVPDDKEIFVIRDQQKKQKEQDRKAMMSTNYYTRGLGPSRENFRKLTKLPPPKASAEEEALAQLILSPEANQASEGLRDFIDQKREIFLAQLAIDTKREELQRLERLEREEAENLAAKEAEINLFRDQFRAFLESDGKSTMEARRKAEQMSKEKLDVVLQNRQLSGQNSSLCNEIAHLEEKLQECEEYKKFIEKLTPPEWRKKHPFPEMYFTKPEQLLDIMQNLEEQNMFLIRHCQEAEEVVERYKAKFSQMLEERDGAITEMVRKKAECQETLDEMNRKQELYKLTGEFRHGNELGELELAELVSVITEFHGELGFDAAATGDTVTMLKRIEDKMESLLSILEKKSKDLVGGLLNEKADKRAEQEKAEKAAKKQRDQEEKTMRALQLATMPIKRKTGRPLLPRMCPQKTQSREKREERMLIEKAQREADQNLLFGPIWD